MRARDSSRTEIVPRPHVAHDDVHAAGIAGLDEGAALDAFAQPQHARHLQAAQRLAQNIAADAELLGQIALGRRLSPGFRTPSASCSRMRSQISSNARRV